MKNLLFLSLLVFLLQPQTSFAKNMGAGIVIGSYAGLSGVYKYQEHEFDGSLAFSLSNHRKLLVHASKLFTKKKSLKLFGQIYDWYYGLGGRYLMLDKDNHDDDYRLGPRGSIGLRYHFSSVPIELFAEAALIFNILPGTNADLDVLIGGRYHF